MRYFRSIFLAAMVALVSVSQVFASTILSAEATITISMAGDCTLGTDEKRGYDGSFMREYEKRGAGFFLENVLPIFSADDLTIVNLEGPLTMSKNRVDKQFSFRGLPEYTEILTRGSVEAVNIANNHTMDYGQEGYNDTLKYLKDDGIGYFGYDHDFIYTVNGVMIGMLGYKTYNYDNNLEKQIKADISDLRERGVNIVIVSFHWGDERSYWPNDVQKHFGHFSIDAGADLVIGHHPHVVQGIESYKGKNIVYSLANFSFGGNRNPSDKDSFIFQQKFTLQNGEITAAEHTIYPVSVSSVKNRNDFRPTPLTGAEAQRVMNKINNLAIK